MRRMFMGNVDNSLQRCILILHSKQVHANLRAMGQEPRRAPEAEGLRGRVPARARALTAARPVRVRRSPPRSQQPPAPEPVLRQGSR